MNSKQTKSKPITTSVPSFAIRFHTSGEELEELYPSEEEEKSTSEDKSEKTGDKSENESSSKEQNKHESSPMRDYLNKFGKRSSSIDTGINETSLNKETSDPWRIFSEFKGKLTKTVEEKLSEIKSKNSESESSPKHKNSSVSDSEEQSFSECSIAKSSSLNSTAEDLEMSSDDENSLLENEKTPTEIKDFPEHKKNLRQRIKTKTLVEYRVGREDTDSHVKISSLSTVHEKEGSIDEIESGVEAFENFESRTKEIENNESVILVAPTGFVDLRTLTKNEPKTYYRFLLHLVILILISFLYFIPLPNFLLGVIFGSILTLGTCYLFYKLKLSEIEFDKHKIRRNTLTGTDVTILEVPAVKEYQAMNKFEGWMNEYPDNYDPRTYHIMKTQSVFLKLEGNVLRISHTRTKIPKRAMWNETKHHVTFTHHRMYNLKGSQIMLLPSGLIHKRLWSKKYPICIILNKEKMNLELNIEENDDELKTAKKPSILKDNENASNDSTNESIGDCNQEEQIIEEEKDIYTESFSDAILEEDNDVEDWDTLTLDETKIYLFARTCRDKEDWYRRLTKATHDVSIETEPIEDDLSTSLMNDQSGSTETVETNTETNYKRKTNEDLDEDYAKFVAKLTQDAKKHFKKGQTTDENNLWINSLIARIIYDVRKHNEVIESFQNLMQRKIETIKLPYFIDSIILNNLTFGPSNPIISNIQPPIFDERGLWIHLDITYEGITSMAIVTKLNLIKLKEQAGKPEDLSEEKSPIFHSDVEDSAESSDEEIVWLESGNDGSQNSIPRKPNTGGKKFLQMVDKIAASKYFQQATENKYIKRAMEGVSKTEIKLTVEIQKLSGTLAINIPPPPSDRLWIGFHGNPDLQLSALPTFGERSLNFMHVSKWIEKKLAVEFQKFLVLPNMEDFVLPMLIPKLPD